MKIVINMCYGGFNLSNEAIELFANLKGINLSYSSVKEGIVYADGEKCGESFDPDKISRSDPDLASVVEILGTRRASGECSNLTVWKVVFDNACIDRFDGYEGIDLRRLRLEKINT